MHLKILPILYVERPSYMILLTKNNMATTMWLVYKYYRYLQILRCPLMGNLTASSPGFSMMNTNGDSDSPPGY